MNPLNEIAFFSLTATLLAVAASPGPGVFATVATSLSFGVRPALRVVAGIVTGHIVLLMLAIFGLSMAAKAMGALFWWVKILGAVYLVGLGLKMWFSKPNIPAHTRRLSRDSAATNWLRGLLVTLANPKAILFYCGILPVFVSPSKLDVTQMALVSALVVASFFFVLSAYAYAAGRARRIFSSQRAAKRLNRVSGGLMLAAGGALVVKA